MNERESAIRAAIGRLDMTQEARDTLLDIWREVDGAYEAKRLDGLLREAALLQERDEARAEVERLREALREWLTQPWTVDPLLLMGLENRTRAALAATRGGE